MLTVTIVTGVMNNKRHKIRNAHKKTTVKKEFTPVVF